MGKKKGRSYSADFKDSAIQLALRSPSLEVVAKELGIPKPTLYTWVTKFRKGSFQPKRSEGTAHPTLEKLQSNVVCLMDENRKLNKTIATLLEEKAILKKAALSSNGHCNILLIAVNMQGMLDGFEGRFQKYLG
ncbi:MAG: transposase [Gammaproteobacteria bacterium]|nr:transposase [Gammaproteobacteria bacterium]